ncbi:hypothetical protein [Tessaracoccus terricola]
MADQPSSTDLHHRFDTLMSSPGLADLRESFARAGGTDPPGFEVGCHTGSWSAPGSDAPILARLSGMAQALADTPTGAVIKRQVARLLDDDFPRLCEHHLTSGLTPVGWFLDRAASGGLRLTSAGHLTPATVVEACDVVPRHRTPHGQVGNREVHTPEVRRFRVALEGVGLLETKGRRVLPTVVGADVRADPWDQYLYLSSALVPQDSGFGRDAALLVLLETGTMGRLPLLQDLADVLSLVGWRVGRDRIYEGDLRDLPLVSVLGNVGPVAAPLAREALVSWNLER